MSDSLQFNTVNIFDVKVQTAQTKLDSDKSGTTFFKQDETNASDKVSLSGENLQNAENEKQTAAQSTKQLKGSLNAAQQKYEAAKLKGADENELEKLQKDIDDIQKQIDDAEKAEQDADKKLEDAQQEKVSAEESLKDAQGKLEENENTIKDDEDELTSLQEQQEEEQAKIEEQAELEKSSEEVNEQQKEKTPSDDVGDKDKAPKGLFAKGVKFVDDKFVEPITKVVNEGVDDFNDSISGIDTRAKRRETKLSENIPSPKNDIVEKMEDTSVSIHNGGEKSGKKLDLGFDFQPYRTPKEYDIDYGGDIEDLTAYYTYSEQQFVKGDFGGCRFNIRGSESTTLDGNKSQKRNAEYNKSLELSDTTTVTSKINIVADKSSDGEIGIATNTSKMNTNGILGINTYIPTTICGDLSAYGEISGNTQHVQKDTAAEIDLSKFEPASSKKIESGIKFTGGLEYSDVLWGKKKEGSYFDFRANANMSQYFGYKDTAKGSDQINTLSFGASGSSTLNLNNRLNLNTSVGSNLEFDENTLGINNWSNNFSGSLTLRANDSWAFVTSTDMTLSQKKNEDTQKTESTLNANGKFAAQHTFYSDYFTEYGVVGERKQNFETGKSEQTIAATIGGGKGDWGGNFSAGVTVKNTGEISPYGQAAVTKKINMGNKR